MKRLLLIISISVLSFHLSAQDSIEKVLTEIEKNNTKLGALKKSVDAQLIGSKTDIYLQNPEVAFNYLWGNPSAIGNRKDFSILQTFDFPTAYRFKNQIAQIKNEQAELDFQKQWMALRLATRGICIDLIYTNALQAELLKRLAHAQNIERSFKLKFEKGDTNILEYNKAQLNLLNVNRELEAVQIEGAALLSELARLNGGQIIHFNQSAFQVVEIPVDFEQWYVLAEQSNPVFGWLKKEVEMSQKQISLNRAMGLPKLQAGYMSESVVEEQFQGISVGMSIPLWENRNKVKYAQANALALESMATDSKVQFYTHLKALHTKIIALQKNAREYRAGLRAIDNSELLKKALDFGEISLINYMVELSIFYESENKLLELEKDLNKANAELTQYQ